MTRIKRLLLRTVVATAFAVVAPLATTAPAAASGPAAANRPAVANGPAAQVTTGNATTAACGWLGGETYNHCGTTHVVLRATDFWGTDYYPCVGPRSEGADTSHGARRGPDSVQIWLRSSGAGDQR